MSDKKFRIFPEPYLVKKAIDFLDAVIRDTDAIFEWGSGSSTIWLARRCRRIVTVEHDNRWADLIVETSRNCKLSHKIMIHLINPYVPPIYAETILSHKNHWDVIFIDGPSEDRFLCTEIAIERLAPGGILIFDNSNTNVKSVDLLDAQCWWSRRFKGEFYLGDELIGEGETGIWAKP